MLFSTVELRHAQIMLTYNSIDHPETTYFGFSVSWQERIAKNTLITLLLTNE